MSDRETRSDNQYERVNFIIPSPDTPGESWGEGSILISKIGLIIRLALTPVLSRSIPGAGERVAMRWSLRKDFWRLVKAGRSSDYLGSYQYEGLITRKQSSRVAQGTEVQTKSWRKFIFWFGNHFWLKRSA